MVEVPFLDLAPLHKVHRHELDEAFNRVMESGVFVGGPEVEAFELAFSEMILPESETVGCGNGTDALTIAARSLNLPPESEAIIPALTYSATATALINAGLKVRLIDVEPDTALLNLSALAKERSEKVRLVVPVHFYGQMVPMDQLKLLSEERGWKIIEDASQAHGSLWEGKSPGYWGDLATFSFYPAKNLGALGDAGAILSRNRALVAVCRRLGNQGGIRKYEHELVGYNSRLDSLQAAFLLAKLKFLEAGNFHRRRVARCYREGLADLSEVILPIEAVGATHVYHLFVIRVEARAEVSAFLQGQGIQTGVHYPKAIHQLPALRAYDFGASHFPVSEEYAACGLSLPIGPSLSDEQVAYVIKKIRQFFGK